MPRKLILASASPRRKDLLEQLRVPFEVVPSAYEEPAPEAHPDPRAFAVHLATEKALEVVRRFPEAVVLGADTVVALGSRLYGKPADEADAARMLRELSGRTHQVITGVALVAPGAPGPKPDAFASQTDVTFRSLLEPEIAAYVATGEPEGKAGAYAIQGYGAILIERISGDYSTVVGLPLTAVALRLRERGIRVLGVPPE